jgi:hypothetical protein
MRPFPLFPKIAFPSMTYTKFEDLDFVVREQFYLWLRFLPQSDELFSAASEI